MTGKIFFANLYTEKRKGNPKGTFLAFAFSHYACAKQEGITTPTEPRLLL